MISDILFTTFKILLGKSRAFHLNETNISNISKSFLTPFEDLIRIFRKLAFTPFVSQNNYSTENEQKQDIINFETQFDVNPTSSATISERAKNIEVQFGLVGGQSWNYIENSIQNIGIKVRIVENIPIKDLISTNLIQYGNNQYSGQYAMYGKSGYLMLGNGSLQFRNKDISETDSEIVIQDPITISGNTHLFLIESSESGPIKMTSSQLSILIELLLRIKPLDQVALINVVLI
ncbi:MAG TPA: hypothetical protein VLL98_05235 [Rickettsiales bacterium]|nr:hypothetical protein [Rickettsiales bacterium]